MASNGEQIPDPATDRYGYSRTALARLVLAYELQELADRAIGGVPTVNDSWSQPGETVSDALDLVHQAQEVLTRAVVYERVKHTSWEAIGEALGDITRQSAQERYREAVQEWKDSQQEPYYEPSHPGGVRGVRLHPAAMEPTATGRSLDAWVHQHVKGRPEIEADEHPVTGHLPALSTAEEMVQVLDALNHLYGDMHVPTDPGRRAQLLERKAALLDRIAVEDGRPEAAEQAAEARARAAELRADTA
ncbi:hypothetical protein ABZT02_44990 [Streptomyces sp. NPDC005402]|uniref:hypothetical protein n=1 Tax=Streptomyces sp. NPDC005402 TaxID=3155338 RepID=UPI0033BE6BB5